MVNRPKDKGTSAESMLAAYLRENGWPWAERRALNGSTDKGDITGCPGLVWEVKYTSGKIKMAEWIGETIQEQANAGADHGILVVKYRGVGERNMDKWIAAMRRPEFQRLASSLTSGVSKDPSADGDIAGLRYDGPSGYSMRVIEQLAMFSDQLSQELFADYTTPVLTRRPPGSADNSDEWYQITYLKHMVRLLRRAGYGDPWEG